MLSHSVFTKEHIKHTFIKNTLTLGGALAVLSACGEANISNAKDAMRWENMHYGLHQNIYTGDDHI